MSVYGCVWVCVSVNVNRYKNIQLRHSAPINRYILRQTVVLVVTYQSPRRNVGWNLCV
jgi:hypothetical protein